MTKPRTGCTDWDKREGGPAQSRLRYPSLCCDSFSRSQRFGPLTAPLHDAEQIMKEEESHPRWGEGLYMGGGKLRMRNNISYPFHTKE